MNAKTPRIIDTVPVMYPVRYRMMAGHINLKLSGRVFFIGNAAMAVLIRDIYPLHKSSVLFSLL